MNHLPLTILYIIMATTTLTSCKNNTLKAGRYSSIGLDKDYYYFIEVNQSKDSLFFATPQAWDNVKNAGIDTFYNSACIAKNGDNYYLRDFESTIIPSKRDTALPLLINGDTITLNCRKLSDIIQGANCNSEYISYVLQ